MLRRSKWIALIAGIGLVPAWTMFAQDPAPSRPPSEETAKEVAKKAAKSSAVDSRVIERIKEEGMKRSEVMATLDHLTNVIGPRLTASPNMKKANNWTRDKLSEWGLKDAHLEAWGPFGRGWSMKSFSAQVVEPQCIPLIAYPKSWSTGLKAGPIVGDVVVFDAKVEADLAKYKGKLKNAIVLNGNPRDPAARFKAQGQRLTDTELLELADAADPQPRTARGRFPRKTVTSNDEPSETIRFLRQRSKFLIDEGVAALAYPSRAGDGGTVFSDDIASVSRLPDAPPDQSYSAYAKNAGPSLPQIVLSLEQFNRLSRMIKQGVTPRMALDLSVQFHDDDLMGYNTVAEIPGSDLKDEIVMLGGHMDSWHTGTGATDNAAGVSVCMEAVRILQALKIQPRRTIRIALWSGEEQGLYGSRAYVKEHFGGYDDSPVGYATAVYETMFSGATPTPKFVTTKDHEKVAAYFNLDNGTGKIRGVYLEGNEAARPIFKKWLEPFREMGAATLSSSPTGGTDHMSFDAAGLPGFQFIQDPIEYDTRTHHSNMDTYERIQPEDMKQASVIMASFIYNAAMRDEKLPRKSQPGR
jgi:carboxypeptidase Q